MGKALLSEETTSRCVQHVAIPDLATSDDQTDRCSNFEWTL